MAINNFTQLDSNHIDVLRELGNIGSGNAATALASLLDTFVDIDVPKVSIVDFSQLPEMIGGISTTSLGISVKLEEDIHGIMYHIVHEDFASKIINRFYPRELNNISELNEMDLSVLREMSNITCAAYVNSLSSLTGLFINITPPESNIEMNSSLLEVPAKLLASHGDKAIFIDQVMKIGDTEVNSHMLLILELESLNKFFEVLGIEV